MKVKRNYEFILTVVNKDSQIEENVKSGEYMYKSECHYYCEKEILSAIKDAAKRNDLTNFNEYIYCIWKVEKSTTEVKETVKDGVKIVETREIAGKSWLVETIQVIDGDVIIK